MLNIFLSYSCVFFSQHLKRAAVSVLQCLYGMKSVRCGRPCSRAHAGWVKSCYSHSAVSVLICDTETPTFNKQHLYLKHCSPQVTKLQLIVPHTCQYHTTFSSFIKCLRTWCESVCLICFQWVIPEMVGQCLSTMLMLVSMHWFIFLLNLPVAAWNIYRSVLRIGSQRLQLGNSCSFSISEWMRALKTGCLVHCEWNTELSEAQWGSGLLLSCCPSRPCRYVKVPMGNMGVFDPTEIHNRGQLKSHMKEAMIKLGYHLLCFFIYLYRWQPSLTRSDMLRVSSCSVLTHIFFFF